MIVRALFIILLVGHCFLVAAVADKMLNRPVEVKLGHSPHPTMLKITSADHGLVVAENSVLNVLFYFGSLVEVHNSKVIVRPEYKNMYKTLTAALQLDPYNLDAYYFAQAVFTWDLGRIREVNSLLELGLSYRTWDASLPFYLGFNYAYFLKDYKKAARYMMLAADISGNSLYTKLASRYLYESSQTQLALLFLDTMITQANDPAVKTSYTLRRDALMAVYTIEKAVAEYTESYRRPPESLRDLEVVGLLEQIPIDPYGGQFYLEHNGNVRSTSKFAFKPVE